MGRWCKHHYKYSSDYVFYLDLDLSKVPAYAMHKKSHHTILKGFI